MKEQVEAGQGLVLGLSHDDACVVDGESGFGEFAAMVQPGLDGGDAVDVDFRDGQRIRRNDLDFIDKIEFRVVQPSQEIVLGVADLKYHTDEIDFGGL